MFRQWPEFGFETHRLILGDQHWVLDWALTAVLTAADEQRHPIRFCCLDLVTVNTDGLMQRKDTFVDFPQVQSALAALA